MTRTTPVLYAARRSTDPTTLKGAGPVGDATPINVNQIEQAAVIAVARVLGVDVLGASHVAIDQPRLTRR